MQQRPNLDSALPGDVWVNGGHKHTGIVLERLPALGPGDGAGVVVQHCSSRQGGVVTNTFTSGLCFGFS
jgi:hypothetical protein